MDSLKAAFDGAPDTGTNVFDHDLDTVARHPGIQARQQGIAGLSTTCQQCPVVASCGGGLYTHRYRTGNGFDNPSVFCADLLKLITHIGSHPPRSDPCAYASPPPTWRHLPRAPAAPRPWRNSPAPSKACCGRMLGSRLPGRKHRARSATPDLRAAWSLLTTLDRAQPKALGTVLRHPYVRVWAIRCLEQLRAAAARPPAERPAGLVPDLGHLGAIAAAAAVRARVQATVTVPVVDTAVHLPTLGRLTLAEPDDGRCPEGERQTATVTVTGDAVIIEARYGSRALEDPRPAHLRAGDGHRCRRGG